MAGARTSWQGIGRPQCGQRKLLSFARIIAVATVAVVAKWVFFFSLRVFVAHTIYGQILPFPWSQDCPLGELGPPGLVHS